MNKNRFRIIFNELRGLFMAVAEHVRTHAAQTSTISGADINVTENNHNAAVTMMRPVAFSVMLMLGMVIVLPNPVNIGQANADIHADPTAPKNQQPIILSAPNGMEVVNIRTPSAAGVSRNTYSQFDVPRQGAIINNSRSNVQSQLGGWLQGNPFLAAGTARVIFNEVNSNNPSYLNGYIEIAGSRAEFILANPNGITCNGCGFINAYRPVLTTGTPIFNGGDLAGYRVHGGDINIVGDGLDASNSNYTDIIARTVNVHAGIWADNLAITTGTNEVNAANTQVTAMAVAGSAPAPSYALDVAALGGMYAKKITMIGTEAGLGVRNAGVLNAYAGSLTIDVNGNLINSNTIVGSTQTNIQAHDIYNTAANIVSAEQLNINANSLSGDGKVLAGGDATINLLQDYTHTATAELQANGNLSLSTSGNIVNASKLLAGQTLTLNAYDINNTALGEISAYRTHLNVDNNFTNRGLINGAETFVDTDTLHNIGTGTIYGNHIAIAADTLNNQDETNSGITSVAVIAARKRLDIGAKNINNLYDSQIFSAGDLYIQGALNASRQAAGSADNLLNNGGVIEAFGSVTLHVDDLQNLNSNLTPQQVLIATDKIDRFKPFGQSVVLESSDYPGARIGNVSVSTRTAGPYSFREYYRYLATATTDETQIVTTNPGQILSGEGMTIAGNVFNHDSEIIAGGDLDIDFASLKNKNSQGTLVKKYTNNIAGEGAFYYDYDGKGRGFRYKIKSVGPYTPADEVTTFNLPTVKVLSGATFSSNGTDVGVLNPGLLPDSRLYQLTPDTAASYLIETDPRFSDYRIWLSSDYLLNALSYDPTTVTKRLGDGFYEQRLIREQINQLTGKRFLTGYANDEQQYQALMTSGTTFAQAHQLIPGVALTEAQVAQLTSDIVWLVEQTVSLPDGTAVQALVPQVYVRLQPGDINGNGSLLAGESIHLNTEGDLVNSGTIAGRSLTSISANNINNLKGRISGNITALNAKADINNLGGSIEAKDALLLQAGHDINIASTTQSSQNTAGASSFTRTNLDRVAGLYVTNANGILVAAANNNINLQTAQISNKGTDGAILIDAGSNLNLTTITTAEQNNTIKDSKNYIKYGNTQEIGTSIKTTGDITLNAGHNLTARAAVVSSESGNLTANAQNNLIIESGIATSNLSAARTTKKSGTFSSKKTERRDTFNDSEVVSSSFSGNTVNLNANNDLTITASNVVSTQDVNLNAKNNLNIEAAQATHDESHYNKEKKSGFSASSTSVGYGSSKLTTTNNTQTVSNVGSTIGSVEGDVNINSGNHYTQTASDVLTPKGDINITAKNVDINSATDTYANQQTMKYKQSGITLSISNPVISAAQTVNQMKEASKQTSDPRMQALAAGTAALAINNAANTLGKIDQFGNVPTAGNTGPNDLANVTQANAADQVGGINISLSIGSSKSKSSSQQTINTVKGSTLNAGGNINITATGDTTQPSNPNTGNINVIGSQLKAKDDITLAAQNDINLQAAQNTSKLDSKNKSSSVSVGVSVNLGAAGGVGVTAGISSGKGKATGNGSTWTETTIQGGNQQGDTVTLNSGADTTIKGAHVSGNQVVANVGTSGQGNLNIQSLQDTDQYKDKQSNTGISITVPVTGTNWGGSISSSNSKTNSNYQSVNEQSGIFAGDGGFQITTQGNTNLTGAVIASTDKAIQDNANSLTTQTLTTSNIENKAAYEAKGYSVAVGVGTTKQPDGTGLRNTPTASAGYANLSDDSNSVTVSAISGGSVSITNNTAQQQTTGKDALTTVATLNRDVQSQLTTTKDGQGNATTTVAAIDSKDNNLAGTLTPIFDQAQVQRELNAQIQITQAFSQVAPKAVGDYASSKLKEAANKLIQANDLNNGLTQEQRLQLVTEANDLNEAWKDGGYARVALHTVVGGLSGNLEGALGAGASAITVPMIGEEIAKLDIPAEVKQALVMGVGAAIGGAVGGTAGAGTALSETANNYLTHAEDKQREQLRKEKEAGRCNATCEQDIARLDALDAQRDREIQGFIDACKNANVASNCESVARHYAETNGYGFASAKFESTKRTGTPFSFNGHLVNAGEDDEHYDAPQIKQSDGSYKTDPGGLSYGPFQLSANRGGMEDFLNYLKDESMQSKDFYDQLMQAGGLEAARTGSKVFVDKFMELTQQDPQFAEYQFESINQNAIRKTIVPELQRAGVDFSDLSRSAKEAVFSIVVQNGGRGADKAIDYVMSDRFALKEAEYNKAIREGKALEQQANALKDQKIALLQSKDGADAATLKKIDQKITKLDPQIALVDQKIQAKNDLIQGIGEWMKEMGQTTFGTYDSQEQFIINLYQWRMDKRPSEAASRFIPERDMLLKMIREESRK